MRQNAQVISRQANDNFADAGTSDAAIIQQFGVANPAGECWRLGHRQRFRFPTQINFRRTTA